jgi:tetratricopeptide (TPR) repeat protein
VEVSGEGVRLTGVGAKPSIQAADSNFFAFHELDGDGSLEVVVDSIDSENKYGAVGIMIRSSLDPSAPFAALMVERDGNTVRFSARPEQNELPGYLANLCALRPYDPNLVLACLQEMISHNINMPGPAYQAAERLLEKEPTAILKDIDLFKEVFSNSYHLDRLSKHLEVASASADGQGATELATAWNSMAHELQGRGNHEEAIALWDKAERLSTNAPFPFEIRQQRLISYRKLDRSDDAVAELKNLFLGKTEKGEAGRDPWMRTGAELILETVSLSDPALVPPITLSVHYAVHYGVAREIAETLEKSRGTPDQKAAAKALALTLRIAARDPSIVAAAKKGGAAFAAQLPKDLPHAGLAMIAFELQQFADGYAAASSVVERMLNRKADPYSPYSREALLLWQLRLADFQGNPKVVTKAIDALVAQVTSADSGVAALSEAMRRLLLAGDIKRAAQVASHYERQNPRPDNSPFAKDAEVFGLLDLYQGKAVPMPIVWTVPAGDEVEVQWEFARDISRPMLQPEVRPLGAPIPSFDKRYSLELYAIGAKHLGRDIPEDKKIATLSEVDSTGQWKGRISSSHRWIVAMFRDDDGKAHYSPAIPAVAGKNLISPIQIDDILNEKGAWTASTKSFWGVPLKARLPKSSLFLSRYQPNVGLITLKHQRVAIDPKEGYVFAAWMKTDNGQGEAGYSYYADASVTVAFFDAEGKQVAEWGDRVTLGGSWTLLTHQFGAQKGFGILPLPAGASTAEVRVNLRTQCEIGDIGFYGISNPKISP